MVGAPFNSELIQNAGQVSIFKFRDNWDQLGGKINGVNQMDATGHDVAISANGNRVAISSPLRDNNFKSSGSVKIFDISKLTSNQEVPFKKLIIEYKNTLESTPF